MTERGTTAGGSAYRPFVPVRGRRVALATAVVSVVMFGVLAVVVPAAYQPGGSLPDSLALFGFGVAVAALMWRYASLRAVPSERGLLVRNLASTRSLEWAEIVAVRFSGGDPWVTLDLDDGETLAVMAIQKADGAHARAEAGRLAALVQARSR